MWRSTSSLRRRPATGRSSNGCYRSSGRTLSRTRSCTPLVKKLGIKDIVHVFAVRKLKLALHQSGDRHHRRRIRDIALPLGLVDVKVCAVTDVWSGLGLVIRKRER
jgi:hypothetical protein